ncbi:MAG TPA: helix-turn-helix domain-containing protein [Euzebyales bacterium]|nr:helix-turn-helix domain-containing protein [Euzebyales bacterium]
MIDAATVEFLERGYAAATMRRIAATAGVAVPTVESLFGTKARLLKVAIDVAIAGDDEPVAVLDRSWTAAALSATDVDEFLAIVTSVLAAAQTRAAGLVLAVFEGAAADPALAELSTQLLAQRAVTAAWLVDHLAHIRPLRDGCSREEGIDTCWVLMDPAVFDRLTRHRGWTAERYGRWFADAMARLLIDTEPTRSTSSTQEPATRQTTDRSTT